MQRYQNMAIETKTNALESVTSFTIDVSPRLESMSGLWSQDIFSTMTYENICPGLPAYG